MLISIHIGQLYILETIRMPLTGFEIRRAKPPEKPCTENDGHGLSPLTEPNGLKGWRFRYRFDSKAILLYTMVVGGKMCLSDIKRIMIFLNIQQFHQMDINVLINLSYFPTSILNEYVTING